MHTRYNMIWLVTNKTVINIKYVPMRQLYGAT
jgi:hypothetical protein